MKSQNIQSAMRRSAISLLVSLFACAQVFAADVKPAKTPTMTEVLAASKPSDWHVLDPVNTLYLELASGRVIIELAPAFAPKHAANITALARGKYFDGLSILRSQDNYVVQWGDPNGDDKQKRRPVGDAQRTLKAEFTIPFSNKLPFTRLPDSDGYAPQTGFSGDFPAARDAKCRPKGQFEAHEVRGVQRWYGGFHGCCQFVNEHLVRTNLMRLAQQPRARVGIDTSVVAIADVHKSLRDEHVFVAFRRVTVRHFGLRWSRRCAQFGDGLRIAAGQDFIATALLSDRCRRIGFVRRIGHMRAAAKSDDRDEAIAQRRFQATLSARHAIQFAGVGAGRLGTRSASSRRSMRANTSNREKGFFMKSSAPMRCA